MSKKVTLPSSFRFTPKITYEVLFADEIKNDPEVLGEMRPNERQIVIKNGQSNTEILKTVIHEIIHVLSDENEVGLTESQVRALELATYRFLRLNGYL